MPQGSSNIFEAEADGTISQLESPTDAKGRTLIEHMTTEEKLNELVATSRALADLIDDMMNKAQSGGMSGMLGMLKAFL